MTLAVTFFTELALFSFIFIVSYQVIKFVKFLPIPDIHGKNNTVLKSRLLKEYPKFGKKYTNEKEYVEARAYQIAVNRVMETSVYTYNAMKFDFTYFSGTKLYDFLHLDIDIVSTCTPIICGYFVFELSHLSEWLNAGLQRNKDMVIHHICSILFFPLSIYSNKGEFFLLIWFFYELSTPFLSSKVLIELFLGQNNQIYKTNGLIFIGLFFISRVLTIPVVLFLLYVSLPYFSDPVICFLGILGLIPVFLNSFWWYKIVLGTIKIKNQKHSD
eukprot:snap_masked-scaffold_11-processed-gene-5.29-mRNA-1 protein AED:1.00 eAED:1.00 QI:0/0/0/0/1/1/2/0/271